MSFKKKLATIDTDTLVRLIRECAGLRIQFSKKSQTFDVLIDELGTRDPGLAVRVGISAVENEPRMARAANRMNRMTRFFSSWAISDPEAYWAWLQLQQEKTIFNQSLRSSERLINWLRAPFAAAMISIQSPLLEEMFHGMQESDRAGVFDLLVSRNVIDGGPDLAARVDWTLDCIKIINEFAPEEDREKLLDSLIKGPSFPMQQLLRDPDASRKFLMEAEMKPLLRSLTIELVRQIPSIATSGREAGRVREWLESVSPGTGSLMMDDVLNQNAIQQIEYLQKHHRQDDDTVFQSLTSPSASFKLHLPEALELAERIEDPVKRAAAIEHINKP